MTNGQPRRLAEAPSRPAAKPNPYADIPVFAPEQPRYMKPPTAVEGLKFTKSFEIVHFSASIHGLPDCGKTTVALTAPRPMIYATEPATVERIGAMGLRVPYEEVTTYAETVAALRRAPRIIKALGVETVIVDTWSTLADNIYAEMLDKVRGYYAVARGQAAEGDGSLGIEFYDPKIEGPIWNEIFRRQNDIRRRLDALGVSVVYVCHTRVASSFPGSDTEDTGLPDAQGQFRLRLMRYPGATFYVVRKEIKDPATGKTRTVVAMHTRRTSDGYEARCKWPGVAPIEPAHLGRLIEKVRRHIAAKRGGAAAATTAAPREGA